MIVNPPANTNMAYVTIRFSIFRIPSNFVGSAVLISIPQRAALTLKIWKAYATVKTPIAKSKGAPSVLKRMIYKPTRIFIISKGKSTKYHNMSRKVGHLLFGF